jgi:hypothetical protein
MFVLDIKGCVYMCVNVRHQDVRCRMEEKKRRGRKKKKREREREKYKE